MRIFSLLLIFFVGHRRFSRWAGHLLCKVRFVAYHLPRAVVVFATSMCEVSTSVEIAEIGA